MICYRPTETVRTTAETQLREATAALLEAQPTLKAQPDMLWDLLPDEVRHLMGLTYVSRKHGLTPEPDGSLRYPDGHGGMLTASAEQVREYVSSGYLRAEEVPDVVE